MSTTTSSGTTQARSLDRGTAPERFARGWHCLGPGRAVRRRCAPRGPGLRRQAGRLEGRRRLAQRPGRLLPAHGRRPDPGHGQGRRDRLPVPRLALGWRRQVQGDPLRPADPAARAHAEVRDRGPQRPADDLARRRGQPGRPRRSFRRSSRASGPRQVHRLELEHPRRPHGALSRDRRQRRGHGALLLHPLRVPDQLPQRLRGPHGDPVHGVDRAARHGGRGVRRRGPRAEVGGHLLRAVVHDQLDQERLQGLRHRRRPGQLPHPDRATTPSCCSTA